MKRTMLVFAAAGLLNACGGSDPADSSDSSASAPAAAETEQLPLRRGDVWEVDPASSADAQMLAYMHGLHSFVRQGDELYTATTRLTDVKEDGAALVASLGGGLEARIEERDGKSVLAFSSGPVATLRPHQVPGEQQ